MSTLNFGGLISYQIGGLLIYGLSITDKHFDNLWILIMIANLSTLVPLPFIFMVDFAQASSVADRHQEKVPAAPETKSTFNNYQKFFRESILAMRKKNMYLNNSVYDQSRQQQKKDRRNSFG